MCPDMANVSSPSLSSGAESSTSTIAQVVAVSLWSIMTKVRLEAFMWGAGTALGELPPYFMARAGEFYLIKIITT